MKSGHLKKLLLIFLFLSCLLSGSRVYANLESRQKTTGFVVVADRKGSDKIHFRERKIDFINFSFKKGKSRRRLICSLPFPYISSRDDLIFFNELPNLIEKKKGKIWYLWNSDNGSNFTLHKIETGNMGCINISKMSTIKTIGLVPESISDISSYGNTLLENGGARYCLDNKKVEMFDVFTINNQFLRLNEFVPVYSVFGNGNKIISCGVAKGKGKTLDNYLVWVDLKAKLLKYIKTGESVLSTVNRDAVYPLGISSDGKKAACISLLENGTNGGYHLWLTVVDMENDFVTPAINLSDIKQYNENDGICKWSPDKTSRYLFLYSGSKYRHPGANTGGIIIIVDMEKKKIVKVLKNYFPKSIRWSPDGKFIVFIESKVNRKKQGAVFIFHIPSATLTKIDQDKDYTDVLFVGR